MKIIIKNLKQVKYTVEINSEKQTILNLKKEIEKSHGFDSTTLKLLFNGVILDDSKTLEDYKIKDESTIIMMNSRVKPKNIQQPSSNIDSNQPKPEEKKPEEPKPVEKKEKEQEKTEEKYSQQINSLVDMGFEKSQAEAAIKAAKGQIDLAVDFLYNGIPEGIDDNDLGEEDDNVSFEDNALDDDNGEDPIKTIASVAKILCQNNPGALTELLQTIQQTNPDLMDLLKEREGEFKTLLEQPINEQDYRTFQRFGNQMGIGGEGGAGAQHGHEGGQRQIRLNLTPEEQEAIKRLKDLGNFSEADVVQAFFACDKNEELTANYLFEQKMRDDEEMSRGKKNNNNNNNEGNGQ